jgi:hypothetical protein
MKYRKLPVIVEAFRLGYEAFPKWAEDAFLDGRLKIEDDHVIVRTLEGVMNADMGVFIVKGVDGELYPCQADIFYETYERVHG